MADARIEELRSLLPRCLLPDWVRLGSRLVRLLRDHHHPDAHEAILNRLLAQARSSVALRETRRLQVPRIDYPPELPITSRKDDIVAAIRAHQVVVIAGETGSGKTTQIPKMCLEAGLGIEAKIGCTQPRRVAALSISRRVAEELNVAWGRQVGCKIRFDDRSSSETYIKFMTDGILLAETQGDPLLSEYNALIIDEAHERSLNIDFLLGYLKGLLAKRTELKLVITSATIDTEAFSRAFNDAPIIEVSGRLYPVDVVYAPFDAASEESGDITFIDAAVNAAEQIVYESGDGDVLIFMPGERDIRETSDLLEGRFGRDADIIPLFGRLSSGEQQRVFAPSSRRKIVIATNIAETSLTIPGIRYVIDSGLARISRYNPRTRTKRLPVEAISQSSANQRKGRSGRVQNGICIRLYSEEDFAERPPYTQPEIQRANLAEVILRMKAFHLGEIETFPFVNPPTPAAIEAGFTLLQELGALDDARELTPLGRDLARLPIDPTLGRMLLQSQHEHATRELLIIAAGLSIQDPRERPLDQKDAAAVAHKRFLDPRSDFLTLLNIWNAFHEQWEKLRTQNQRRKFCKAHFLSYTRMREWQDLHTQLHDALEERGTVRLNESNAAYDAIHRSILTGLLGHVGTRTERNVYKAFGNRQLMVFPGSALFDRNEKTSRSASRGRGDQDEARPHPGPLPQERGKRPPPQRGAMRSIQQDAERVAPIAQPHDSRLPLLGERAGVRADQTRSIPTPSQPAWIMAGEVVETSQLFARTLAGIDPMWIVELGAHLCKMTHHHPHWSPTAGRVLVQEKITLHGMEVHSRKAAYGNINPKEATEIFIRSALVEEELFARPEYSGREDDYSKGGKVATHSLMALAPEGPKKLPPQYRFLEHNRQVRQKIATWQTRVRRHDLSDPDQALFDFYARRLENISSIHELNRLLGEHPDSDFLHLTEADLAGGRELNYDAAAFPDAVPLGGQPLAVSYAYAPGEEQDGVTIKMALELAQTLSPASISWAVPGLREEQVAELLRALPKAIRRQLMPFPPKVTEIARELRPTGQSLLHDLARFIEQHYGIALSPSAWPADALPSHLRPRIEIVTPDQKTLGVGRDLEQLRQKFEKTKVEPAGDSPAWRRVAQQWERFGLTGWTFDDLPERVTVGESAGLPLYGWPGLQVEEENVSVRLFRSQEAARRASLPGVQRLVELALQKDLAWLAKDLRGLSRFDSLAASWVPSDDLQAAALTNLKRHLLPAEPLPALAEAQFKTAVEQAKTKLPGLGSQLIDRVGAILQLRKDVWSRCASAPDANPGRPGRLSDLKQLGTAPKAVRGYSTMAGDLDALVPKDFLERVPFEQLPHLPRYLKTMLIRAERAGLNPLKEQERVRQLTPYQEALRRLVAAPPRSPEGRRLVDEFRWMVEEFKVSLFAQELRTAFPVSPKRLDLHLDQIRQA